MRVVVTNAVLTNSGDAAIFQAIQSTLVREGICQESDIHVLDNNAAISQELYPEWTIFQQPAIPTGSKSRIGRLAERVAREILCRVFAAVPKAASAAVRLASGDRKSGFLQGFASLAAADVVISSGGTYLVDHYDFRGRVSELRLAAALGKPVVLWTQSMGPFKSRRSRRALRRLDGVVSATYFRDERSMKSWESVLPLPANWAVSPDVVFGLVPLQGRQGDNTPIQRSSAAVSVRDWGTAVDGGGFNFGDYAGAMASAVEQIQGMGYDVTALSTCQGTPGYSVDDAKTAGRIFAGLDVKIDGSHHTPNQLLEELTSHDVVIATRMHMAILALTLGKPVIAVAYEFKTKELFEGLGLGENVILIEHVTSEWIVTCFNRVMKSPESASLNEIQRGDLRIRAGAPAQFISDLLALNTN